MKRIAEWGIVAAGLLLYFLLSGTLQAMGMSRGAVFATVVAIVGVMILAAWLWRKRKQ